MFSDLCFYISPQKLFFCFCFVCFDFSDLFHKQSFFSVLEQLHAPDALVVELVRLEQVVDAVRELGKHGES